MMAQKAQIRDQIRARLPNEAIGPVEAEKVLRLLGEDTAFQDAQTVALYAAMPGEVPSSSIDRLCRDLGKSVCYPRLNPAEKRLEFCLVSDLEHLVLGDFGFLQPPASISAVDSRQSTINLFLIPGLGFSPQGDRLGRGQGYYDRTLSQPVFKSALRYGIAVEAQILENLPTDSWDLRVHKIFTPEQVIEACAVSARLSKGGS